MEIDNQESLAEQVAQADKLTRTFAVSDLDPWHATGYR
jgi:hypothetical protein